MNTEGEHICIEAGHICRYMYNIACAELENVTVTENRVCVAVLHCICYLLLLLLLLLRKRTRQQYSQCCQVLPELAHNCFLEKFLVCGETRTE